jgi:hypothetical protein
MFWLKYSSAYLHPHKQNLQVDFAKPKLKGDVQFHTFSHLQRAKWWVHASNHNWELQTLQSFFAATHILQFFLDL